MISPRLKADVGIGGIDVSVKVGAIVFVGNTIDVHKSRLTSVDDMDTEETNKRTASRKASRRDSLA